MQILRFPAVRGMQAGAEYYISMVPLRLVPRIFQFDKNLLCPETRAQRILNKTRIPALSRYILDNPDSYVFSALTASIDGDVRFNLLPSESDLFQLGTLHVPLDARFFINDGQHRRAAIEVALKERPELGDETIAVVFFVDAGLKRSQQVFADLNRFALRPTQSLNILYDHRDPYADQARRLALTVPSFEGLTEMERSTISNRSRATFTLSGIHRSTQELLLDNQSATGNIQFEIAATYWTEVGQSLLPWCEVRAGRMSGAELRQHFVCGHTVALVALGKVGRVILRQGKTWPEFVRRLTGIDWHRSNQLLWEGNATLGGRISNSRTAETRIAEVLLQDLGLKPVEPHTTLTQASRSRAPNASNL